MIIAQKNIFERLLEEGFEKPGLLVNPERLREEKF